MYMRAKSMTFQTTIYFEVKGVYKFPLLILRKNMAILHNMY